MDAEAWRKRTLWRATHRGIKEADMLVGGFAERWVDEVARLTRPLPPPYVVEKLAPGPRRFSMVTPVALSVP